MKIIHQNSILLFFVLALSNVTNAQKKDENIGTEVINVVKPYTPSVSDAFKIKETPAMIDEENSKKEVINYNIFSFPVASTFIPSKGNAEGVEKTPGEKTFKNYFNLGAGNYTNINADLFITENISNNEYLSGMIKHFSSQGGIKNVILDDKFANSSIDISYGNHQERMVWKADIGFKNQVYNWYGLPALFGTALTDVEKSDLINGIDPKHNFNTFYLDGKVNFNQGVFTEADAKFNRFWDNNGATENRFYIKPSFAFETLNEKIKTNFTVDYVGGAFSKTYLTTSALKYGFINLGANPNIAINKENWSVNAGFSLFYSIDNQYNKNKLYVYPQLTATLKIVDEFMLFYSGLVGDLQQNTYNDFVNTNPFLAPNLFVAPTNKQFDFYAGLKGKLASFLSYDVKASYKNEKNKALFKSNDFTENTLNQNFEFGNSFGIVYDNLKTISVYGELNADISKKFSLGINGTINSFTSDVQKEAWNLPALKINSNLSYNFTKKWFVVASVFFVGERKDLQINQDIVYIKTPDPIVLKSYFDANCSLGYKHSERLTAYLKLNNIANQQYQKWLNYQVQGFQFLIGAAYKFDF